MSEVALEDLVGNEDNIRVYGGELDSVSIAPVGTEIVETLAPLGAEYKGLGLLDADGGIEEEIESENLEVRVLQGFRIARSKTTSVKHTLKAVASETNAVTVGLRHPAAVSETNAEGITVTRGIEKTARKEYQLVVDSYDGDVHKRRYYTRVVVSENGTLIKKADEQSLYEFTFTSLGAIIDITNDPAVAVAVAGGAA